jgi:general secretion pathway protein A
MYLTHYDFEIKPFEPSPDPKFTWLSEKHKEALATLKYGIQENKGFISLTGDAGTGKTTLVNCFLNEGDTDAIVASVPDPDLTLEDFFRLLSNGFGIDIDFETRGEFLIKFKDFLDRTYSDQKKVLLIIDEAQRLNQQVLEQIRLLSNIESGDQKLFTIFLVGQTDLHQCLMDEQNGALRQRIAVHYHIEPLTQAETRDYIDHRLQVAGSEKEIFSSEAVSEIFSFSKGCPRLINNICDRALLSGYVSGMNRIDRKVVRKCADELVLPGERESARKNPGTEEKKEHKAEAAEEKTDKQKAKEHDREAAEQAPGGQEMKDDPRESDDPKPEARADANDQRDAAEKKPEAEASESRPHTWGPGAEPRALSVRIKDQESPPRHKSMGAARIIAAGLIILMLTAIALYFFLSP